MLCFLKHSPSQDTPRFCPTSTGRCLQILGFNGEIMKFERPGTVHLKSERQPICMVTDGHKNPYSCTRVGVL